MVGKWVIYFLFDIESVESINYGRGFAGIHLEFIAIIAQSSLTCSLNLKKLPESI